MKTFLFASLFSLAGAIAGCSKSAPPPAAPTPSTPEASAPAPAPDPTVAAAPPTSPPPPVPAAPAVPPYTPAADVPDPIRTEVGAPDRAEKDRALDAGRKPAEMLAFFQVAPGQKVAELFAATGYTTELLARVVGDSGKVYAQNTKPVMDRYGGALKDRASKPGLGNIVVVEQPAETPFPPEAKGLDAVICVLNYHDLVWLNTDLAKLNKAVFAALKPGGVYGIVDHAAAKGSGTRDAKALHRIDEDSVKHDILAAGFKLDGESDVLANPSDPHDWSAAPGEAADKRGTSDRFTLRFVKPGKAPGKPTRSSKKRA